MTLCGTGARRCAGSGRWANVTRPFAVITFYCYGTLIDWESGLVRPSPTPSAALEVHAKARMRTTFDKLIQIAERGRIVHNTLAGVCGSK